MKGLCMEKNEMEWKLEFGNRSIWLDDRIGLDFWIVVYLCEEYEGKNIPKNWLDGILECRRGNKHFRIRWKQNNQSRSPHILSIFVCSASHTSFVHDRMLFNWIGYLEHRRCNWICCGTPGLFFDFNFLWTFRDDRSSALTRMHSSLDSKFWITWTIIVN